VWLSTLQTDVLQKRTQESNEFIYFLSLSLSSYKLLYSAHCLTDNYLTE